MNKFIPSEHLKKLRSKLNLTPESPGVYIHKNKKGEILYIGKAKNLKNRPKPAKNPYTDPEYRKTKFKSRMDYLKKKGVASHVGDIAPMTEESENFEEENK